MKARFELDLIDSRLHVTALLPCLSGGRKLTFLLHKDVRICETQAGCEVHMETALHGFFGDVTRVTLSCPESEVKAKLRYSLSVQGWHNEISPDRMTLSVYSLAFPYELPEAIDESECVFGTGFDSYEILDAEYDDREKRFIKHQRSVYGEIVNIIGFRKGLAQKGDTGSFRYACIEKKDERILKDCADLSVRTIRFYSRLYGEKPLKGIHVVVLGNGQPGAYNRGELIVLGSIAADEAFRYNLIGHELAHNWFYGADLNTYHDWLNETGAEWSKWLLLLEEGKTELYEANVEQVKRDYRTYGEPIRTRDGLRPASVHVSGTYLFYLLSEQFGRDIIQKLLVLLSGIEEPTTEKFLASVNVRLGASIAAFIESRLDETLPVGNGPSEKEGITC